MLNKKIIQVQRTKKIYDRTVLITVYLFLFYLYIYSPDSQESDGGVNILGKQLPRPAFRDIKILLSACNLMKI